MCQLNNSVTFSEQPLKLEEFLKQVVETLGITIDRYLKERPFKRENQIIEKIGCIPI